MKTELSKNQLLTQIPPKYNRKAWEMIVRLSTTHGIKRTKAFIVEKYKEVELRKLEKNYKKFGKNATNGDKEVLDRHFQHVKDLFDYEKKRQENLEKKALQLIGQSSTIMSIITIFIGLLLSKLFTINLFWLYILVPIYFVIIIPLGLTMIYSIKSLRTRLYNRPSQVAILDPDAKNQIKFLYSQIALFYNAVEENHKTDDKKAIQMDKGYKSLYISIISICIFSIISLIAIITNNKKAPDAKEVTKVELIQGSRITIDSLQFIKLVKQFDSASNTK